MDKGFKLISKLNFYIKFCVFNLTHFLDATLQKLLLTRVLELKIDSKWLKHTKIFTCNKITWHISDVFFFTCGHAFPFSYQNKLDYAWGGIGSNPINRIAFNTLNLLTIAIVSRIATCNFYDTIMILFRYFINTFVNPCEKPIFR